MKARTEYELSYRPLTDGGSIDSGTQTFFAASNVNKRWKMIICYHYIQFIYSAYLFCYISADATTNGLKFVDYWLG